MNQTRIYTYNVNLDERGYFYADVRDEDGETVFEVRVGASLNEDETSPVDDGFMRDMLDTRGLTDWLRSIEVIPQTAHIIIAGRK